MTVLVDTHILLWWVSGDAQLSTSAKQTIETTLKSDDEVLVSSMSAWEVAMLVEKGRLVLTMDVAQWFEHVKRIDGLRMVPVDETVGILSTQLPGEFHKDPADRMIVATARKFAIALVTADEKILAYTHVKTIP